MDYLPVWQHGSGLVERVEVVEQLHALFQRYPFQRIRSYQETGNDHFPS